MESVSPGTASSVFSHGSSRSRMRKIFLLAAMPFIATWKNEPSWRMGRKKSAESSAIMRKPCRATEPVESSRSATPMPAAAPPRAMTSMTMMELSCMRSTFIVMTRKRSASSFICLWRASSAWYLERGEALQVLQEAVTQRRVLVPVGSEQALRDSLYDHDHEGDERHEHEQDDRGRHADGRRDGKQRDRREQGIEELGQVLAKVGLELLGALD